jgi:hypothetical protein
MSSFFDTNSFWEYAYFPTLDGHLTNKLYVDGSIATAVATETASILADDNCLYWFKFFYAGFRHDGDKQHGNLVMMDTGGEEIGGTANKVYDSRLLYCE